MSRAIKIFIVGATGAALTAVAPVAGDCPVGPNCICKDACSLSNSINLSTSGSFEVRLMPPFGCSVESSSGSMVVFAAALGRVQGQTDGPCGTDMCHKIFLDTQADAGSSPDLTMQSISLGVSASAGAGGVQSSASASGSVSPLSYSTATSSTGEIGNSKVTCFFDEEDQITTHSGFAMSVGRAQGSWSTSFEGDCSGLTAELEVNLEMSLDVDCSVSPPGCDDACPGAGARTLGAVFVSAGTSSSAAPGPGAGPSSVQGVFGLVQDSDGNVAPMHLGFFEGSGFDPVNQPDTLVVNVPVPDGATRIDATPIYDYISEHDGDINGDGLVCAADAIQMSDLVGAVLGDGSYTARADFDLDGAISGADLAAFEQAYDPSAGCCLGDLDGDGTVGMGDVLEVLSAWGPCTGLCPADLDEDGEVMFSDILIILAAWGPCPA